MTIFNSYVYKDHKTRSDTTFRLCLIPIPYLEFVFLVVLWFAQTTCKLIKVDEGMYWV